MSEPSNTNKPSKSIWQREILPGFPPFRWARQIVRWLFSRRGLRRMLIVLAWTATIVALVYAEENWRGRHAWNKMRRELEASGATLDWTAFIPKPIPDEQNFASTPVVQAWFPANTPDNWWKDNFSKVDGSSSFSHPKKKPPTRQFLDLVAWQNVFAVVQSGDKNATVEPGKLDRESRAAAAPAILALLKDDEQVLAELRAASAKPLARYPVVYDLNDPWAILIPHLARLKGACIRLQLRASAELAAGRNDAALDDLTLMLYLADSVRDEPFLISYLVRLSCLHIASQTIWEGLAQHAWSEAQLQTLQTRLQQYDLVTDLNRSLSAERAAGILTGELIRKKGAGYLVDISGAESPKPTDRRLVNLLGRFAPGGWYYQEEYNYCRLFELQLNGAFDAYQKKVSPHQIRSNAIAFHRELPGGSFLQHNVLAALLLPALANIPLKAAQGQSAVDQATLACALERYRMANGQFPETLDALAPRFISTLPHDVINGGAFHFRRTDSGQFILYSVGWNERDDGGTPGKRPFDERDGDWVWQYPGP